jgi:hypothetical protein
MRDNLGAILFLAIASFHATVSFMLFRHPEQYKRLSCELALFEAQRKWIRGWPSEYLQAAGWMFGLGAVFCVLVAIFELVR